MTKKQLEDQIQAKEQFIYDLRQTHTNLQERWEIQRLFLESEVAEYKYVSAKRNELLTRALRRLEELDETLYDQIISEV